MATLAGKEDVVQRTFYVTMRNPLEKGVTQLILPRGMCVRVQIVKDDVYRVFLDEGAFRGWYTYLDEEDFREFFR